MMGSLADSSRSSNQNVLLYETTLESAQRLRVYSPQIERGVPTASAVSMALRASP
jgi:hypothetical protein